MTRTRLSVPWAALFAGACVACGSRDLPGPPPPSLAFDIISPRLAGAPLACSPQALWETSDGMLALACLDAGRTPPESVIVVSNDNGATWSHAGAIPASRTDPRIVDGAAHVLSNRDGRLWHAVSMDLGRSWSRASTIVDYPVTLTNHGDVALAGGSGIVHVAWSENRDGTSAIYTNRSNDQGLTWQPSRLVERGLSGKKMTRLSVAVSGDRIAVAWTDDREASTLFDIRCSVSDDGGRNWRPSVRVNDDTGAVWQDRPVVAIQGGRLLVLFDDFREPWVEGVGDYNIYAGHSRDDGRRYGNVRVNDRVPGMQLAPSVAVSPDGARVVASWWDVAGSLFGELSAAQSLDFGESWSPTTQVWKWEPGAENNGGRLAFRRNGRLAVVAHVMRDGRPAPLIALERPREAAGVSRPDQGPAQGASLPPLSAFDAAPVIVHDEFAAEALPSWLPVRGTWLTHEGSLIGFGENETLSVRTEPVFADGEVSGLFRLDPVEHRSARLLIRATPAGADWRGYLIENFFRMGVRLWRQEGSRRIPVASALFPFQRDRSYRFRLAIKGSRLDYAIDDRLVLQSDGLVETAPGRVGLGGEYFPVYFDDVTIRALDLAKRR